MGAGRRVAVVGPLANASQTYLGNYSPINTLVNNQSLLAAVQRRGVADGFSVAYAPGCAGVACPNSSGFGDAVAAAAGADVALVVLGLCSDSCPGGAADAAVREGEGHDRTSLELPGLQTALAQVRSMMKRGCGGTQLTPLCNRPS